MLSLILGFDVAQTTAGLAALRLALGLHAGAVELLAHGNPLVLGHIDALLFLVTGCHKVLLRVGALPPFRLLVESSGA